MQRRSLAELVSGVESSWPMLREWFAAARNPVEILPGERDRGEATLLGLQVTDRSPLGAVALETGGILFDHGWLRFLGSGSERMRGTLLGWNGMGDRPIESPLSGALVVAHDAVGGFSALNGAAFPGEAGSTWYRAADTLGWEDLGLSYSHLLYWAATGDLAGFYASARWPGWEGEVRALSGDRGLSIYPPLWADGGPVSERSRRPMPMTELWGVQNDIASRIRGLPSPGAS
jgi:hypothetical protein